MQIVVLGVSGSGKSTIGISLAKALGITFLDGDDFHPESNVQKMSNAVPLTDEDRWPWLDFCGEQMIDAGASVLACSSLKRSYRDKLREKVPGLIFVHLDGSKNLLTERMSKRQGHFMKLEMLESQLATLEKISEDELAIVVDIDNTEQEIVETIKNSLDSI